MEITRDDQVERLVLTEEIRKQVAITGRATTCWRVYYDGEDSLQYEERPQEGELIKVATSKAVRKYRAVLSSRDGSG